MVNDSLKVIDITSGSQCFCWEPFFEYYIFNLKATKIPRLSARLDML